MTVSFRLVLAILPAPLGQSRPFALRGPLHAGNQPKGGRSKKRHSGKWKRQSRWETSFSQVIAGYEVATLCRPAGENAT